MSSSPPSNHQDDAPLPPGWSRGFSKSQQRVFYSHAETKHTQWHFPTRSEAHDPHKAKQRAELNKKKQAATAAAPNDKKRDAPSETSSSGGGLGTIVSNKIKVTKPAPKRPRVSSTSRNRSPSSNVVEDSLAMADSTSVAIIVPYRDLHPAQHRAAHLKKFIPHMHQFFHKLVQEGSVSNYHIYIVEQSNDGRKFNRGKLLNIGFDYARKKQSTKEAPHDVFIFHDVDLLPQDDLGRSYAQFPKTPLHIARVWDRYSNNPKYMGGVVSFSSSDYKRINGYPNTFWGWGGEDDEMQKRCQRLKIKWDHPNRGTLVDLEQMTLSEKLDFLRSNKEWKCMVKWEALEEHEQTWRTNGLVDLTYSVLSTTALDDTQKATKVTVDVKLNGNHWSNAKSGVDFMGDANK